MKNIIKQILREGLITEITVNDAWTKFYSDVNKFPVLKGDESLFNKLNDLYPRRGDNFNKGYFTWLYNLIRTNQLKEEDFYKAKEYLRLFDKFFNKIPVESRDINKFKNLNDLYDVVQEFEEGEDTMATSKTSEIKQIKQNEIDKVYEDNEWLIMIPKTERASCLIGKGTQWCTAADQSNNMFDSHNSQGPLYVMVDKYNDEKYQLHFETNQLMDATDRAVSASYFFDHIMEGSNAFTFLQEANDKFWDFVLETSADDMASGGYSETFEEALTSDVTPRVLEHTLETLRAGEDSRAIYLGYVYEKNSSNISDYEIERLFGDKDVDDEDMAAIVRHLIDIDYDFEEIDNENIQDFFKARLALEKHKVELDTRYQVDKERTLRVNRINIGEENPYNITMGDKSGDVDLETLLNLLHQGQLFEGKNSIKNILRKNLIKEYFDDEDEYDDDEDSNEEYFRAKLTKEEKRGSQPFHGRNVIWYGTPGRMIYLTRDELYGMFGNIYDKKKMKYLTNLIIDNPNKVELECSYGHGNVITFIDIKEEQEAYFEDRFGIDYDGKDEPSTTGNKQLDVYVGKAFEDMNWFDLDYDNPNIEKFFDKYKFSVIEGKPADELIREFNILEPSETEMETFKEFIDMETSLKAANDKGDGDFNKFKVQLRDGHHRVFAALDAGEQFVCVDLPKEDIAKFKGYYKLVE